MHPAREFVEMGSGANRDKYDRLRAMGLVSAEQIVSLLPRSDVDAGVVAFVLCMGETCKALLRA